jgi:hypothetical protein
MSWIGIVKLCAALLACVAIAACAAAPQGLTTEEAALAQAAGVPADITLKARVAGTGLERLMAGTDEFDQVPAAGLLVQTRPGAGHQVLEALRRDLAGTPWRAYLADDSFGHEADKVAVLQADDLGYLAIAHTDGINYDLDHAKVMARYREWQAKYGLRLTGAGMDWIEAEFDRPPADWDAFAREVYAFCPDVVDQGTGDVPSLAREMKAANTLYLWWD